MTYLCGRCIHFDVCYVPRSIGCVEICGHFKEEPKEPMTNEEWFTSLSTEEKAEFLFGIAYMCSYCGDDSHSTKEKIQKCLFKAKYGCQRKDWVEWLKEIHHAN